MKQKKKSIEITNRNFKDFAAYTSPIPSSASKLSQPTTQSNSWSLSSFESPKRPLQTSRQPELLSGACKTYGSNGHVFS